MRVSLLKVDPSSVARCAGQGRCSWVESPFEPIPRARGWGPRDEASPNCQLKGWGKSWVESRRVKNRLRALVKGSEGTGNGASAAGADACVRANTLAVTLITTRLPSTCQA